MSDLLTANTNSALMQAAKAEALHRAEMAEKHKGIKNYAQIEAAAKDFEAVYMAEMMKPMFEGLKPDPMFGGGKGEEVFHGMLVQEYSKIMADQGGIGLAQHVKAELIKIQEEMGNE